MFLSKSANRVIARAASAAFVLCYVIGAAQASHPPAPSISTHPPCHDAGHEPASSSEKGCSGTCHEVAQTDDFPVLDWAEPPVLVVSVVERLPVSAASAFQAANLRVKPPPHSLLYCCLRN
jgi:hypothetical protein